MADKIAAWAQDMLTRVYKVHWEESGLAVEFGDKALDPPGHTDEPSPSLRFKKRR
jgi:hypothetical protein